MRFASWLVSLVEGSCRLSSSVLSLVSGNESVHATPFSAPNGLLRINRPTTAYAPNSSVPGSGILATWRPGSASRSANSPPPAVRSFSSNLSLLWCIHPQGPPDTTLGPVHSGQVAHGFLSDSTRVATFSAVDFKLTFLVFRVCPACLGRQHRHVFLGNCRGPRVRRGLRASGPLRYRGDNLLLR